MKKKLPEIRSLEEHIKFAKTFTCPTAYNSRKNRRPGYFSNFYRIASHFGLKRAELSRAVGWIPNLPTIYPQNRLHSSFAVHYANLPKMDAFTCREAMKSLGFSTTSNTTLVLRKLERAGLVRCVGVKQELSAGRKKLLFSRVEKCTFVTVSPNYVTATVNV